MYVPATPAQPAVALAPVGIVSATPPTLARPIRTGLALIAGADEAISTGASAVTGSPSVAGTYIVLNNLLALRLRG